MSGIYIPGMAMQEICIDPNGHRGCPLFGSCEPYGYFCKVNKMEIKSPFDHQTDCPLIPVPDHGRLIDEKDIVPKDGYIIADGMACIPVKDIVNAPTIIPASGGSKNE